MWLECFGRGPWNLLRRPQATPGDPRRPGILGGSNLKCLQATPTFFSYLMEGWTAATHGGPRRTAATHGGPQRPAATGGRPRRPTADRGDLRPCLPRGLHIGIPLGLPGEPGRTVDILKIWPWRRTAANRGEPQRSSNRPITHSTWPCDPMGWQSRMQGRGGGAKCQVAVFAVFLPFFLPVLLFFSFTL